MQKWVNPLNEEKTIHFAANDIHLTASQIEQHTSEDLRELVGFQTLQSLHSKLTRNGVTKTKDLELVGDPILGPTPEERVRLDKAGKIGHAWVERI